jgi:hypothetical protein
MAQKKGEKKLNTGNPIVDDILKNGYLNEHLFGHLSQSFFKSYQKMHRKRILLMTKQWPQLPKPEKHLD